MKNTLKYKSYRVAFNLLQEATLHKDLMRCIAAIAVAESIIADRCQSYLAFADPSVFIDKFGKVIPFPSTGRMVALLKKRFLQHRVEIRSVIKTENLFGDIVIWLQARNTIIHSFAKSKPSTPTETVESFHTMAIRTAEDGLRLAKLVSKWHKNQLRFAKQTTKAKPIQ